MGAEKAQHLEERTHNDLGSMQQAQNNGMETSGEVYEMKSTFVGDMVSLTYGVAKKRNIIRYVWRLSSELPRTLCILLAGMTILNVYTDRTSSVFIYAYCPWKDLCLSVQVVSQ